MKKEDARGLIISEWRRWKQAQIPSKNATGTDGLLFFTYLQREKPALLDFRSSGDPWQTVHGWLLRSGFVSD